MHRLGPLEMQMEHVSRCCYSTAQNPEPFGQCGRNLRKCYPFLCFLRDVFVSRKPGPGGQQISNVQDVSVGSHAPDLIEANCCWSKLQW